MNTKKIKKRLKKVPVIFLTAGAAIILGFLSFTGMFAFLASLPLTLAAGAVLGIAIASGVLSLAYEGELFWQNFKNAIKKLIHGSPALELKLTKEMLLEKLIKSEHDNNDDHETNEAIPPIPSFMKAYKTLLAAHHAAKGQRHKKLHKQLKHMEKHIANQLFHPKATTRNDEKDLADWLLKLNAQHVKARLKRLKGWHIAAKVMAMAAGIFMTVGATYLLIDAMAMIPFFAALSPAFLPMLIIPTAIIAGAAFALQTYNAATDMINHSTLIQWAKKIKRIFTGEGGYSAKSITWAIFSIIFVAVAILLALCTLGTWKTIVEKVTPLFHWMSDKAANLVFKILIPGITGLAGLFFNIQNTLESFDFLSNIKLKNPLHAIQKAWAAFKEHNTLGQRCNPFRIITFILNVPTRIALFLGHIGGIGVTADQVAGVPAWAAASVGTGSEFFEDLHYFVKHPHKHHHDHAFNLETSLLNRQDSCHGHSHERDLPTRVIRLIFTYLIPIYTLAALWDAGFRENKNQSFIHAFKHALQKMYGEKADKPEHHQNAMNELNVQHTSQDVLGWQKMFAIRSIDHYVQKRFSGTRFFDKNNVEQKKEQLNTLKQYIQDADSVETLTQAIQDMRNHEHITHHRFHKVHPNKPQKPTTTQAFLDDLRLDIMV